MEDYRFQDDLTDDDLARLRRSGISGVDTETTGLQPRRDILSLVQIADGDGVVNLIRRQEWIGANNLRAFLADASILKVFHVAWFDIGFFLTHLGVETTNAYCTYVASKIARTYTDNHHYDRMIKEFFGEDVVEPQYSTDWYTGEYTEVQKQYAVKDVVYLIRVRAELERMMATKGTLPSGVTYTEMNARLQAFLGTLAHAEVNGWSLGDQSRTAIFSFF